MNRLYVVESGMTLTGGMADHRLRMATSQMTSVLAQLALAAGVPAFAGLTRWPAHGKASADWIKACADDLRAHRGRSLVMAGSHLPEEAHALALLINQALGNVGETVFPAGNRGDHRGRHR